MQSVQIPNRRCDDRQQIKRCRQKNQFEQLLNKTSYTSPGPEKTNYNILKWLPNWLKVCLSLKITSSINIFVVPIARNESQVKADYIQKVDRKLLIHQSASLIAQQSTWTSPANLKLQTDGTTNEKLCIPKSAEKWNIVQRTVIQMVSSETQNPFKDWMEYAKAHFVH